MNDTLSTQQSRETIECDFIREQDPPDYLQPKLKLQANDGEKNWVHYRPADKGAEPRSHIPQWAAFADPRALNELIPDWQERGAIH